MEASEESEAETPRGSSCDALPVSTQCEDVTSGDVIPSDDVDPGEMEVGERDYSEGALCKAANTGGLTLKGQINLGGKMEITHNNIQDNRTTTKHVHHHQGDLHQHTHNQYVKEGDVIHHHGEVHHTKHVHYDSEAGYAQIKDQSELAMQRDEKVFVETWAYRAALDQVSGSGMVVLTGPPSSGKSCTAHRLLRHFQTAGFTPLVLHRFEEWRAHVGGNRQQVILLEDIFGKDQFQNSSFVDWVHTFPAMQQLAQSGRCIIIITVIDTILDTMREELGNHNLFSNTLSMNNANACLSEDEKRNILENHLKEFNKSVSEDQREEIVHCESSEALFPSHCRLFAESSSHDVDYLAFFVATPGHVLGACGTGPKVFIKIEPQIMKKCLLKPKGKTGRWNFAFTNTRSDIHKPFGDDNWTTTWIQEIIKAIETDSNSSCDSEHLQYSEQTPNTGDEQSADTCEPVVKFLSACKEGNIAMVREMLESQTTLPFEKRSGFTALHIACLAGNVDVVEMLLQNNCPVDVADDREWTPLHVACSSGQSQVVQVLIKYGANMKPLTFDGMTALHIACRYGDIESVQCLLENGASTQANSNTGFLAFPLHVAAYYGHVKLVQLLITFKAHTDVTDRGGWLPLHFACQEGHLDVVNLLLSAHATALAATGSNLQLHIACENGHMHFINSLLQCGVASHNVDGKISICRPCYLANKLALDNLSRHHACPDRPSRHNMTALYIAAQNGHHGVVEALLQAGACTEVGMEMGWTPLFIASLKGHHHIVQSLLQYKTDVNERLDNVLLTPLHLAALNGHQKTVDILLTHGASPDIRHIHGYSPLHQACKEGHSIVLPSLLVRVKDNYTDTESANLLLSLACDSGSFDVVKVLHDWIPNIFENGRDSGALYLAIKKGSVETVEMLLDNGFPVHKQDCGKATEFEEEAPLPIACVYGHLSIVQLLISRGANLGDASSTGDTALHLACRENFIDIAKFLLENDSAGVHMKNDSGETPLHLAADKGLDDMVNLLIAWDANINAQDSIGETPLMSGRGYGSVVDILLQHQADTNILNNKGETLLHQVCTYGIMQTLPVLLSHDVDLECRDKDGRTALFRACRPRRNKTSLIQALLEKGVNVNAADAKGITPVQLVCELRDVDLLHSLLQHGGDVNIQSESGDTPLHQACVQGDCNLITVLMQAGARVNALTKDGNTPLHQACQHLQPQAVKLLLEQGADMNIKNSAGQSPTNIIQQMNLSTDQCSENERRIKLDKKTEIMLTLMESSQQLLQQLQMNLSKTSEDREQGDVDTSVTTNGARDYVNTTHVNATRKADNINNETEKNSVEENNEKETCQSTSTDVPESVQSEESTETAMKQIVSSNKCQTSESKSPFNDMLPEEKNTKENATEKEADVTCQGRAVLHKEIDKHEQRADAESDCQRKCSNESLGNAGSVQPVEASEDGKEGETCSSLNTACHVGDTNLVVQHLLTTSNVDEVSPLGRTPLHEACAAGQSDIVELLLQHGSNPTLKDGSGYTPLHLASHNGHVDTVDLLLARGVDVNVRDREGKTALLLACCQGHGVVVSILLANKSDVSLHDNNMQTCLHLTSSRGYALVVGLLVSHGAPLESEDPLGNTPLMLAVARGHSDVFTVLLNYGANVERRNHRGENAKDILKARSMHLDKLIARHVINARPPFTQKQH